jgi:uncharacterized membrane protein
MPSRSLAGMISLGIALISALRVALVWDRLPERMASHYGPSGKPDGFMMRGEFFIFYFIVFGLVVTLFTTMSPVVSRIPRELVNIPHREYWLTDERWPQAIERMARWMAWFGVAMAMLAAAVLHLVLRSNLQQQPLENNAMFVLLGAFFVICGGWLVGFQRAFRPPA